MRTSVEDDQRFFGLLGSDRLRGVFGAVGLAFRYGEASP
ncbi:MAG: hypothetical protein M2R45_04799 [Verrucomicrobia subdivision 3 bacterium]|nr:hypothetical protein [Limisphaerales bacterium]MCS1417444.1 hypothetical protein [Limisphaerales bacterium]